jgi:hypothetical protein
MFLPPDFDGYVRAGLGAESTAGAFVIRRGFGGAKPLAVHFLAEDDHLLGAGYGTKGASFASLAVDDDFTHLRFNLDFMF